MAKLLQGQKLPPKKERFLSYYYEVLKQLGTKIKVYNTLHDHYCNISETTFNDAVSPKCDNLNAEVVIAFCKVFGYDIFSIYVDESEESDYRYEGETSKSNTVVQDLPKGFSGRFFGYFFNSAPEYQKKGVLDQFVLDLSEENISLVLRHYALGLTKDAKYTPREITLNGSVVFNQDGSSPNGIVTLLFASENDFCVLSFNKFQLNGDLFFRRGAMMLSSRGYDPRIPVVQSFIFVDRKIDLDNENNKKSIQGILSLSDKTILIKEEDLKKYYDTELFRQYLKETDREKYLSHDYVELDEQKLREIAGQDNILCETLFGIKSESVNEKLFAAPSMDRSWHYFAEICNRDEGFIQ